LTFIADGDKLTTGADLALRLTILKVMSYDKGSVFSDGVILSNASALC